MKNKTKSMEKVDLHYVKNNIWKNRIKRNKAHFVDVAITVAVLLLLVLSIIKYISYSELWLTNQRYADIVGISSEQSNDAKSRINERFNEVNKLAEQISNQNAANDQNILTIIRSSQNKFSELTVIESSNIIFSNDKIDYLTSNSYNSALKGFTAVENRIDSVIVASPIIRRGYATGAVIARYSHDMLATDIEATYPVGAYLGVFVIDSNGNIVLSSKNSNFIASGNIFYVINKNSIDKEDSLDVIKNDLKGTKLTVTKYKYGNQWRYISSQPLGINDWHICYDISGAMLNSRQIENNRPLYIWGILVLLCLAMIIIIIIRKDENIVRITRIQKNQRYIDQLTGLLNEDGFCIKARNIINATSKGIFILSFDINNFEFFSAMYGIDKGNALLKKIADETDTMMRKDDFCARIYADEFSCMMLGDSLDEVLDRVQLMKNIMNEKLAEYKIKLAYGIYEVSDKTEPIKVMLYCSKMAKRQVKNNYENNIGIFNPNIRDIEYADSKIEFFMENALQNNEFYSCFQPKYDAKTQQPVSAEALLRWKSSGFDVPLERMIALFERNGFIVRIDFFMLELVCKKQQEYIHNGLKPIPIAVNFSQNHFVDKNFAEHVIAIINKYELDSSMIEVEFTETSIAQNVDVAVQVITKLQSNGLTVTMDDFGSGYSSLNLLKNIPVDCVKLDKEFLNMNENTEKGKCIIKTVLTLAKSLNITTVVEGVETKEQYDFLKVMGCDLIQGFYFSKPLKEEKFDDLMKTL